MSTVCLRFLSFALALAVAILAPATPAVALDPLLRNATADAPPKEKEVPQFGPVVHERCQAILDQFEKDNDPGVAREAAQALFDQVLAQAPEKAAGPILEAAETLRLVTQFEFVNDERRVELLQYLRAHPKVRRAIVFLIKPEDRVADAYEMLDGLRKQDPELETYANLAAAMCVVHDSDLEHHINENMTRAAPPLEIYRYYRENESKMVFGLKNVPAELLVYVVDNAVSIAEMQWALKNYKGHSRVGALFFDIDYDYAHYRQGTPKKVTVAGWNLPNIKKFGGVCADQAYFAVAVGKCIGVPTAYTYGRGGVVAHAWVGFLETRGRNGWWNFDIGRYPAYQGVRGQLMDPQVRKYVPDSYVALMAEMIGTTADQRHTTAAYVDAAQRLLALEKDGKTLSDAAPLIEDVEIEPRPVTVESAEQMLEAGLRHNAGYPEGWYTVSAMAEAGKLSLGQKKEWASRLQKMCGSKYPDFTLDILKPMIATVEDVNEQNALWEAAFRTFARRLDLAADARLQQGRMWQQAGEPAKAGRCYEDIVSRFANAGPFVLDALKHTEEMLVETGREAKVVVLYQQAWSKIRKPGKTAFLDQSNWVQVGRLYADKLNEAGRDAEADRIRAEIQAHTG